jgi:hypothetical protein
MNDQSAARNEDTTSVDIDTGTDKTAGAKEGKTPKAKLVRDSFTIPKAEYTTLNELRQRSTRLAQPAKKSEILRAGIELLKGLSDQAFLDALAAVPNLKTGRPKKDGEEEGDAPAVKTGRKIIDKIAKRPARSAKTAAKATEPGEGKPARTLAEKSAKAVKRAAAGAKPKANKAGKAGKAANKAGKGQRATRPSRDEEAEEV